MQARSVVLVRTRRRCRGDWSVELFAGRRGAAVGQNDEARQGVQQVAEVCRFGGQKPRVEDAEGSVEHALGGERGWPAARFAAFIDCARELSQYFMAQLEGCGACRS